MNLIYMESCLDFLGNNKNTISDYIRMLDRYIEIIDSSKKLSDHLVNYSIVGVAESLKGLESLRDEVVSLRGEAWQIWCAYSQELNELKEAKSLGDLVQFSELKDDMYAKLDKAKLLWENIGSINQKLGTIYKGASLEYGEEAEGVMSSVQPGEEE